MKKVLHLYGPFSLVREWAFFTSKGMGLFCYFEDLFVKPGKGEADI